MSDNWLTSPGVIEPAGASISHSNSLSEADEHISRRKVPRSGPTDSAKVRRILDRWRRYLPRLDWYVRLERDIRQYILAHPTSDLGWQTRWAIYDCVAEALEAGRVGLVTDGPGREDRCEPITHVVLHHSGTEPSVSLPRLSAMGLLRLYVPVHLDQHGQRSTYKQPIYSNHWSGGRQVYYAYHWLIRSNGETERLLGDCRIGWHSGNAAVNRASVGVCFAGDYSFEQPSDAAMASLHDILARYSPERVLLHSDVNGGTDCPGTWAAAGDWRARGR